MLGDVTSPQDLDERFRESVAALSTPDVRRTPDQPVRDATTLTGAQARALFDAQLTARHLDLAARWLHSFGEGFHTVGSAGHEGNAAVAAALRPTDPVLLHHRSAAFFCARAAQHGDGAAPAGDALADAARDVLRGVVASAFQPMTGGRQMTFGSAALHVIPTSGTAGAHLPRAVGLAAALGRGSREYPADAIVVASFGDAAVDQADAGAALTAAGRLHHTDTAAPLLLICEDNGWGGPAPTPPGWATAALRARPGLHVAVADGCDPAAAYDAVRAAADRVRETRRPAVLHLSMVRLLGHDAADEQAYRDPAELARDVARDPLLATARLLVDAGLAEPGELIARYDELGWDVRKLAEEVLEEPKLASGAAVAAPLAPRRPLRAAKAVADDASRALGPLAPTRHAAFGGTLPEDRGPLTLAETLHAALTDALATHPRAVLIGAAGYAPHFASRALDVGADELAVLGHALGAGLAGELPIATIADPHRAADQLTVEAAGMAFRSAGAYRNPMLLRLAGLAHDTGADSSGRGDNGLGVLLDVPGLVIAVPARPADAAPLLRSCLAAADVDGSVCVLLEPLARRHTRDLAEPGDGGWLAPYAPPGRWAVDHIPIGRARTYGLGAADDLTILTFGNGVLPSLRVATRLAAEGYGSRVVDLRWLAPLPAADLVREATATGRVLIVDETRRSGGVGEGILAALVDGGFVGAARRIAAADSPTPPGPAARHILIGEDAITQGAHTLLAR
jgi:2-oxoisovalerate dehydrogenase E1 component